LCVIVASGDASGPARAGMGQATEQLEPYAPEELEAAVSAALEKLRG
jgi:hypothetical protein